MSLSKKTLININYISISEIGYQVTMNFSIPNTKRLKEQNDQEQGFGFLNQLDFIESFNELR